MGNFTCVAREARLKETSRSRLPGKAGEHHDFEVLLTNGINGTHRSGTKPNSTAECGGNDVTRT
jgi:hypothetical protein